MVEDIQGLLKIFFILTTASHPQIVELLSNEESDEHSAELSEIINEIEK